MKIRNLLVLLILMFPGFTYGQPGYLAGTAMECIEPDQSLISLHLGGYGAPREGRFTLQWKVMEPLTPVTAMAGMTNRLYISTDNKIMWKSMTDKNAVWTKAGDAGDIRLLGASDGFLYAVNVDYDLLVSKSGDNIKWKKKGSVDRTVSSLTASAGRIFVSNQNGDVWEAEQYKTPLEWTKLEPFTGITGLAADSRKLYALNGEGSLYQLEYSRKGSRWLKAAYKNGITIKEDIEKIAISGNSLFGIGKNGILYKGEHRTEGNLTSRALAIRYGEKTAVIVNVDITGLNDRFTGMIKEQIMKEKNIPPAAVFINSSHTHFAPVAQDWLTWQEPNQLPDSIYLYSTVKNGIVNSIEKALGAMAPAELFFGRGKADIGYNRSLQDHPEIYDNAVDVLKVTYKDNRSDTYLFLASCHPVFSTAGSLHYTISANYPGVARRLVEERTGTANSLFIQGTAGDINPVDDGEYISGEKLANEVIAILNRPMTRIEGEISCFLDTINIPVKPWTKEEILAYKAQNIDKTGDVYAEKNVKWSNLMLKYYEENAMPSSMPVYINTINIGNWKLVGFSRETTTGYGLGVKGMWPGKLISVAGYTNDVSSYLPTHMHLEKKGYEGLDSFFWYGMPNVFPMSVDDTILGRIRNMAR